MAAALAVNDHHEMQMNLALKENTASCFRSYSTSLACFVRSFINSRKVEFFLFTLLVFRGLVFIPSEQLTQRNTRQK